MAAPKTPKIKVYRPHWGLLSIAARHVLQVPTHVTQGSIYIAAPTKISALVHAAMAYLSTSAAEYRIARGDQFDALLAAGLLAVDGEIVVTESNDHVGSPIARFDHEAGRWAVIGHYTGHGGHVTGVDLLPAPIFPTDQD